MAKKLMLSTILSFTPMVVCSGCVTSKGDLAQETAQLSDREVELPKRLISIRDQEGYFRAQVRARPAGITKSSDGQTYEIYLDMGTEAPILCLLSKDDPLPASWLKKVLDEKQRQFQWQPVGLRSFAVGNHGAHFLMVRGAGKTARETKLIAASLGLNSVLCEHEEQGYRRSFRRVVSSLINSLSVADESHHSYRLKGGTLFLTPNKSGQRATSFQQLKRYQVRGAKEVPFVSITVTSYLRIVRGQLQFAESNELQTSDRDGRLHSSGIFANEDGRTLDVEVFRSDRSTYRVIGTIEGQNFETSLRTRSPLRDRYHNQTQIARFLGPGSSSRMGQALHLKEYLPLANPDRISHTYYKRSRNQQTVKIRHGTRSLRFSARKSIRQIAVVGTDRMIGMKRVYPPVAH